MLRAENARSAFARTLGIALPLCLAPGCSPDEKAAPVAGAEEPAQSADSSASTAPGPTRGKPAPVSVSGEEPYDSPSLGALHGTILFRGKVPERFALGAVNSAECKHHPEVDQRQNIVVVDDGKLAGAFVTLASGYDKAQLPPLSDAVVSLEQKGCMYVPRVLALRVGQLLTVTNDDPATHNVHSHAKRNQELNQNMGAGQKALEFRFSRPEQPVPFQCDIHPWMGAAVFVEEHPWFAVSDEQGAFRIRDVPPGEYVVEAIHESLGKVSGSVTVKAGSSTGFTLTLGK